LTLRDLFSLVTIAALIVGWRLDHSRLSNRCETSEISAFKANASVNALKHELAAWHRAAANRN
jgi:hypothetical protein